MRIAFLNLCHCDPAIVARVAKRLTADEDFDMYIHIDLKTDDAPFRDALKGIPRVFICENRQKVYWGGFNAIKATITMLKEALQSERNYDYFVVLQNLDYTLKSNLYIKNFFIKRNGTEFIRACKIAGTRDWHYARKYKIFNKRDDDFYLSKHSATRMYLHYTKMLLKSLPTLFSDGIIHETNEAFPIHYGAAQWAVTRLCAEYLVGFYETHPKFNQIMSHIQFPDEEYFHTVIHNSNFKHKCSKYDEPEQRWLVNWRNLHYFEYPKEITVFTEKDFEKLMSQDALFVRKVKTGISDKLLDMIDAVLNRE